MTPEMIGVVGFVVLFALLLAGMPVGFGMAMAGFFGAAFIIGFMPATTYLARLPYTYVANFTFSVLPFFILMGNLAYFSGMTEDAYRAARSWLGNMPGGLSIATIGGCAAFAATCGSSMASAVTMTKVAYPEMEAQHYDPKLSLGSIAAGGTLGILIPPSAPMIVYAIYADQSVGKLFMAGILPGILIAALFIIGIYIWAKRVPSLAPPSRIKSSWRDRLIIIKDFWAVGLLILVVMGGIWSGIITATEAGGIGAFGAFLIALARKKLPMSLLISALKDTVKTTAMIFFILIGAMIFTAFMAQSKLPYLITSFFTSFDFPPMGVMIVILFMYLILGCIMDVLAMQLLTFPIVLPLVSSLGFDLIWFGVTIVIMNELALITPPIGMNVFVISGAVKDVPMFTIFKGVIPFVVALIIGMALLLIFPEIALFLPTSMR